jgi:hypothetical protein
MAFKHEFKVKCAGCGETILIEIQATNIGKTEKSGKSATLKTHVKALYSTVKQNNLAVALRKQLRSR